ncbi:diguanylate cyclase [Stenotrophomonas pictorum JCM 9942]|uniref:diguanylate cyclase n=1 Tax=Stenotrophomonas pictorum JCM 9942 TaxID=1236960 RepID=A0A0R0ABM2_9GAMM|nr:GGDEF domain-containing protein [Stenotrophomonas pictorum]KRG42223.1 diguanylate cyclase [Stenotrophomonas pictorum JCM 9942]
MADSTETPLPRGAGLGRILSRRQAASAEPAVNSPRPAEGAQGMAQLQLLFAAAREPEALLHAFAQGMATLPGELGDMGQRLHSAQAERDWERYGRLLRQLIDKYIRTVELDTPASANGDAAKLRDLLRNTLDAVLAGLLVQAPELQQHTERMGAELRHWQPGQSLAPVEQQLRELCHQVGVRSEGLQEQHDLLLNLFDLLLENIAELLEGGSWLQGQISAVRQLLGGPLDRSSLEHTRNNLREVIYRQGLLKQGIDASKTAMKELMIDFVQQVDGMATDTGDYHDRLASYAISVRQARSIADLSQLLQDVLQDTARVQAQALRARDHLANARAEAVAAEQRVLQLERELEEVGSQLRTDPLTGALNRRGLEEVLGGELRAGTTPLSVAMLDLDHFGQTNATHGHAGGDQALRHLVAVIQHRLCGRDHIARLGGDEFVLVLPELGRGAALETVQQLQTALVQRPFLHEDQRVQVRFSAGVASAVAGETADALLQRADRALYAAKRGGRNLAILAD